MKKNILIVDDEKNIRMTLKYCLEKENYNIDSAVNGEEGLEKIKNGKYDLVILDIQMPGLTGMEVLAKIREDNNKVNVIIMTAYGTVEKAVEAMKLGAIDFLSKPFTPEEIRNIVRDVLTREELNESSLNTAEENIRYAKKCILEGNYEKGEKYLKQALIKEVKSAEVYNLLGVLAESIYEIQTARQYYRAALAFDPSYQPSIKNLERISQFKYVHQGIDMGDDENEEK